MTNTRFFPIHDLKPGDVTSWGSFIEFWPGTLRGGGLLLHVRDRVTNEPVFAPVRFRSSADLVEVFN